VPADQRPDRGERPPPLRRRITVAAALLALAVAVAVLARPLLVLPLVVLSLAATVLAGWTALVSRGRRRVISAVLAAMAGRAP
jgi:hypothetical protein